MNRGRPALSRALQPLIPAVVGVLTIVALGAVALRVGAVNLGAAQEARLNARRQLVTAFARNVDVTIPLGNIQDTVAGVDLVPGDRAGYAPRLDALRTQHQGDPASAVVLVAPDGTTMASSPAEATLPPHVFGDTWDRAVAGSSERTSAFVVDGTVATAALLPVGQPEPWAVVVVVQPALQASLQTYYEGIGSLNGEAGGLAYVDRNGVAVASWNRADVGRVVVDPDTVATLPAEAVVWEDQRDGVDRTRVGAHVGGGFGLLFEQADTALYGDLAAAQAERDRTTVAVLTGALAALVLFQVSRVRAARRAEARITALMANSQDVILACHDDGTIAFASASLPHLLGVPPEAWEGRPLEQVSHPDDVDTLRALLAAPDRGPLFDVRLINEDGAYRWFDVEAGDIRRLGQAGSVLLTCREVGDRKALQDTLDFEATHDPLTGLMNRARFSDHIQEHLADGRAIAPLALLYLDLDHFKPVNDTMGHEAGDEILRIVARRLVETAGAEAAVCRLGGDEFAVLLLDAHASGATDLATRLIASLGSPIAVMGRLATIGTSIGVAVVERGDALPSPDQLIRRADQAMYEAKNGGRSAYRVAAAEYAPTDEVTEPLPAERPAGPERAERATTPAPEPVMDPSDGSGGPVAGGRDRSRRLAGALPLVAAVVVILGIAVAGHLQSRSSQAAAEASRVAEHMDIAVHSAEYYTSLGDFERLAEVATQLPWTFDGGPIDQYLAAGWTQAFMAGPGATGTLLTADGRTLLSLPADAGMNLPPTSPAWQRALAGRVGFEPLVEDADEPRAYLAIPITRDGEVQAVFVLATSNLRGTNPTMLANAAAIGHERSGWSDLTSDGRIYASWDPNLVGTTLVDPAAYRDLEAPAVIQVPNEDGDIVIIAPLAGFQSGITYLAFTSPADEFFEDLRTGQTARDVTLVAVVVVMVLALALVNFRRERQVRRSEARLDTLVQHAHDIVIVLDDVGRAGYISSAIRRVIGHVPDAASMGSLLEHVHPDDRAPLTNLLAEVREEGVVKRRDVRVRDAAGQQRWFDIDARDLRDHREVGGVLITCHDVSERKLLQDEMAFRARHDALTGLANRSALGERLDELATVGSPLAVLFVDLDHFKPVNDRFGHQAGDLVLQVVAERLDATVRSSDLVCRLGGDEFAVVMADVSEQEACATAERVIQAVRQPITIDDHEIRVGATIGIAVSESARDNPEIAVRQADQAMYQAKAAERGTYAVFGHAPMTMTDPSAATPRAI